MKDKKVYTSEEFSNILGVEKYNLRFYEREGLFQIQRDNNKYRIYDGDNFSKLSTFLAWNSIGYSVKDSIQMIQLRSGEEISSALHQQELEIDRSIAKAEAQKEKLNFMKDLIDRALIYSGEISSAHLDDFYFFRSDDNEQMSYIKKIGLNEYAPFLYHANLINSDSGIMGYVLFEKYAKYFPSLDSVKLEKIHFDECHCKTYSFSEEKESGYDKGLELYLMIDVDGLPWDLSLLYF